MSLFFHKNIIIKAQPYRAVPEIPLSIQTNRPERNGSGRCILNQNPGAQGSSEPPHSTTVKPFLSKDSSCCGSISTGFSSGT